ncbi:methionine--tRNA ligase [Candidatus Berkelbacteria bacterium]|nr:methionine--tRNA ligase [Candidatus Berkelbacteria bacterium]
MKTLYVTTPIYYANDKPHVGHAYTTVAADVLARYWRKKLGSEQVFFLTGTDEHGQKIADAAQKAGLAPKAFVDRLVPQFETMLRSLAISNDIFMRTTAVEHIQFAKEYFQQLKANDDVYLGTYEGFYCVGCESYKTESELVDGKCPDHPNLTPERRHEKNYFFRLTKYISAVIQAIESNQIIIKPDYRRNELLARLKGEVRDISISRPNVEWGIPLPWDESHTFYVWVEALLNYLSALEIKQASNFWPANVQLMAKEILWFHGAIWPALLIAGGRDLPKTIFAHGWFTIDGQKMSKTLGNVIDPIELVDRYGADAVRYFLLSAVPFGADGDLAAHRFAEVYKADLADGLGNLLQRTVTLISRSELKIEPGAAPSCADADRAIEELRLDEGLKAIWLIVRDANKRLEEAKPWEMIKNYESETMNHELVNVLTTAYRQLETIAAGLMPFMPETSAQIFAQLRSSQAQPLFPRLNHEL